MQVFNTVFLCAATIVVTCVATVAAHAQQAGQAQQDGVSVSSYMSDSRPNYGSDPVVHYQNDNDYPVMVGVAVRFRCGGAIQNGSDETFLQAHSTGAGFIVGGCSKSGDDLLSVHIIYVSKKGRFVSGSAVPLLH